MNNNLNTGTRKVDMVLKRTKTHIEPATLISEQFSDAVWWMTVLKSSQSALFHQQLRCLYKFETVFFL